MLDQELCPQITIIDSDENIVIGQTEDLMQGDRQPDQFCVRRWRVVPQNVAINLIEFPEPALLWFLESEKGRNAEPFDRFPIVPRARRDQTSQSRSHLRFHTDVSTSLVDEAEQLCFQLFTAFSLIQFGRFQRRSVVLLKSK